MNATREDQEEARERSAEQQPVSPMALEAEEHGKPGGEVVEEHAAAQPLDGGADGAWDAEMMPSPPSSVDNGLYDDSDGDSALGDMSIRTATSSIGSSIFDVVEENGRTYHRYRQGKYMLPNDPQEQARLSRSPSSVAGSMLTCISDLQHGLFKVMMHGKLYLAPIEPNLHHVLDIATGTGIWAIEFANEHPSASIVGTDLSAIQPLYVPPNCQFQIDDAEDEWIFQEKFDYVHGRALFTCFKDPKQVLTEAVKSLQPGGYLELQDMQFPFRYIGDSPKDSAMYRWNEFLVAGAAAGGRPWDNVQYYRQYMEELGLEDIVEKSFYWPTNTWARSRYFKDVGTLFNQDLMTALDAVSLKVMTNLGWSADEIREFLVGVTEDIKDTSIHAYLTIKVIYGRKRLDANAPAPGI